MDGRSYGLALVSGGLGAHGARARARWRGLHRPCHLRRSGPSMRGATPASASYQQLRCRGASGAGGLQAPGAIVDIDAHHGNGPRRSSWRIPRFSHLDPPGPELPGRDRVDGERRRGRGVGSNVNVNLPAGTGDPGYHYALDRIIGRSSSTSPGGDGCRVRCRREPLRPSFETRAQDCRRIRADPRRVCSPWPRMCALGGSVSVQEGWLQPGLRALLLARRDRTIARSRVTRIRTSSSSPIRQHQSAQWRRAAPSASFLSAYYLG